MATNEYVGKTTPTEAFVPAGLEIRDEVIAEHSAGIELEVAATERDPRSAFPPRGEVVPERTVADRMRERAEGTG